MNQWPEQAPREGIHLWVCTDLYSSCLDGALDLLAPEEQQRARAYRFENDRRRYLGSALLQRSVLARYTSCSLRDLSFSRNQWGKPALDQGEGSKLHFSLSRSHEVAILAVSAEEVGADVEYAFGRNGDDFRVKEQFSEAEQGFIKSALDEREAFFEVWARKEAYLKGIGRGLSHPLSDFDVTVREDHPVRDWAVEKPENSWWLRSIQLAEEGYGAAIAQPRRSGSIDLVEVDGGELLAV